MNPNISELSQDKQSFKEEETFEVLDIGCGNGRFLEYLKQSAFFPFKYVGIDNNKYLLEKAKILVNNEIKNNYTILNREIIKDILEEKYILPRSHIITLFGVMHHIPSYNNRLKILNTLKDALYPNGLICISIWKFLDEDKIKHKILDWNTLNIKTEDLETHDYLLPWDRGVNAIRYCHYVSDNESGQLLKESNLKVIKKFRADGKNNKMNEYVILQKT